MILPSQIKKVDGLSSLPHSAPQKSILRDLWGGSLGFVVFFVVLGLLLLFGLSRVHAYTAYDIAAYHLDTKQADGGWENTLDALRDNPNSDWNIKPGTNYGAGDHSFGYMNTNFNTGGKYGKSLNINRSGHSKDIPMDGSPKTRPSPVGMEYPIDYALTFGGWFKQDDIIYSIQPDTTLFTAILYFMGNATNISIGEITSGGEKKIYCSGINLVITTNYTLVNSGWRHIVCRIDPTSISIFVDGEKMNTQSTTTHITDYSVGGITLLKEWWDTPSIYITWYFDDLFLTDRSLADWQIASIFSDVNPYSGQFFLPPPPLPPPPSEIEYATSTISFVYGNYTNKWINPTPLFSEITEILGKLVNPILQWTDNFKNYFSVDNAKSQAELLAGSTRTLLVQTKAFDNIFGNFPITGGIAFLVLVILVKGFFVISTKIASFIKR